MELLLSKVDWGSGDLFSSTEEDPQGELMGFVRVVELPIRVGSIKGIVEHGGNLVVEKLPGVDLAKPLVATIQRVEDVKFNTIPSRIPIRGRILVEYEDGKKSIVGFTGSIVPTGYLQTAFESLTTPGWSGDNWF
jgi:hypothetical protein